MLTLHIELLFSMNIPQDIATKYNFLKEQTYDTLGLPFVQGVITYVPPVNTNNTVSTDKSDNNTAGAYSSTSKSHSLDKTHNHYYFMIIKHPNNNICILDYMSTGGVRRPQSQELQLFTQIEELMKSQTEHLANMTKGIILEEDNSFI